MDAKQLSMLEVAIELLSAEEAEMPIYTLIEKVLELKELEDPNGYLATQLYTDITTSSLFVFCGEGKWDLKTRQSLEEFDRDGSYFNTGIADADVEDEIEETTLEDFNIDDDDDYSEEDDDDYDDEDEYYDDYDYSLDDIDPNEDDDEVSYLDEQEYNDIMDDYEDMYEDN